jgi:hypothetical protein
LTTLIERSPTSSLLCRNEPVLRSPILVAT